MSKKTAVVVFNMGGPDSPEAVRPFLRNLFSDPAIINLPNPFRAALAQVISRSRAVSARKTYALIGGASPLLPQSQAQAEALETWLRSRKPDQDIKSFVAMRYWQPQIKQVQAQIARWGVEQVILLPLYPQFSTTTTGSFFKAWEQTGRVLPEPVKINNYATDEDFIGAHARQIIKTHEQNGSPQNVRLIFTAHGLPQRIVDAGDPYPEHIAKTCAAIKRRLPKTLGDTVIAYQSKVGPLAWIGPSTLDEIARAAKDNKGVLLVPVAFVSEHVETLVELDIDYRQQAEQMGIKRYDRVPTLGLEPGFIRCLGRQVLHILEQK